MLNIEEENQTLASITYQNYFRLYQKLSGMTGTAMTEAEEFFDIYKLNVVSIPTNKKMKRKILMIKFLEQNQKNIMQLQKKLLNVIKRSTSFSRYNKYRKIRKNF